MGTASDAAKATGDSETTPSTLRNGLIKTEDEDGGHNHDGTNGDAPVSNKHKHDGEDISTATTTLPSTTETATATPTPDERRKASKRKRGPSPPWNFATASATRLNIDGRRVSARVNADSEKSEQSDVTGRSRSVSHSVPRSRAQSPPWKAFGTDRPSVLNVDGKRVSGRVKHKEMETPKRVSPRGKKTGDKDKVKHPAKTTNTPANTNSNTTASGSKRKADAESKAPANDDRPSMSTATNSKIAELQAKIAALQPTRSFPPSESATSKLGTPASQSKSAQPKKSHKRKASQDVKMEDRPASPPLSRKVHRQSNTSDSPERSRPSPKIRLRFQGNRKTIPPVHRGAISNPAHPPQPSLSQVMDVYELQEMQGPYMENDRGPPDAEEFARRAIKAAAEEGAMRRRILKEAEDGGALSKQNLSLYQPDRQSEPPEPVAKHDQLVAHALFLRQLQVKEKVQHRLLAKKIAFEALDKWKLIHGPTEEDIIVEQDKMFKLVAKQVIADLSAKWALVEAHVQEARRKAYEAEQSRLQAQRLQEKLEWSENLLAKQRGDADSDVDMEEDSTGDAVESDAESGQDEESEEDEENEEDDNIVESEDEANGNDSEDEGDMDAEELAAYKAHQAALEEQRQSEPPDKDLDVDMEAESQGEDNRVAEEDEDAADEAGEDEKLAEIQVQDDADMSERHVRKRGRTSRSASASASATVEEKEVEGHLSSDDSTEMDSEKDVLDGNMSDEDMTTGDEVDDNDNDTEAESEDEEEPSLLGFYSGAAIRKLRENNGGLPTPMTSVENGGDDENPRSGSEAISEGQTGAGAPANADADQLSGSVKEAPTSQVFTPAADEDIQPPAEQPDEMADADAVVDSKSADDLAAKTLVPIPALMRGTLRSYQHAGLDWLASLYRNGVNGILADEMGLGKTIQTISLLAHLAEVHEVWEPHLVIVPTSVILNWVTEFNKFLPGFRVLPYYGTIEERAFKRKGWVNDPHHKDPSRRGYNVIITSYNIAMQDMGALRNVQWHYLILDEAHNIRNFASQRWQTLIRLRTRARLLLTGTPLQNDLAEVWALLTFLAAGDDERSHGALEEFLGLWKDPVKEIFDQGVQKISEKTQKIVNQLHVSLRPFLLRRKKDEVEKDLPKKTEYVVVCKLSKRQRQLYQDYMGLAETKASLAKGSGVQAGAVLLSLRRVCNHPDLFDPRPIQTSFAMDTSPAERYSIKEQLIRQLIGVHDDLPTPLLVAAREHRTRVAVQRARRLDATSLLQRQASEMEALTADTNFDPSTVAGSRALQRLHIRQRKLRQLRASIQATESSFREIPVYGCDLRELVTINKHAPYTCVSRWQPNVRALQGWPAVGKRPLVLEHPIDWHLAKSTQLQMDIATCDSQAERMNETLIRFTVVPPAVTVPLLDYAIPPRIQNELRLLPEYPADNDFGHEARVRAAIAFPDTRLLIYDSGKLQRLTELLRQLQSRGSRSLIFTQMVHTLNILERFLGLMNLPYLRLDGNTSVERRALMAAEFNRPESKYQCMILSSRAGGVGLNLTGASSVIFYDLDWNPQMDRQCMDRAHRIGQVRDVEVYKMVSEKTVEENILRRANQKSLLDQTVIQEGHFTTDYQMPRRDEEVASEDKSDEVNLAIDRFLGGEEKTMTQALESVEDKEDVAAAQQARKEDQQDDIDFDRSKDPSKTNTPGPGESGVEAGDDAALKGHVDLFMIKQMEECVLKDWVYVPPPVRRLDKHGRDPSHRPKRKR